VAAATGGDEGWDEGRRSEAGGRRRDIEEGREEGEGRRDREEGRERGERGKKAKLAKIRKKNRRSSRVRVCTIVEFEEVARARRRARGRRFPTGEKEKTR
jgi:hypothetical protein